MRDSISFYDNNPEAYSNKTFDADTSVLRTRFTDLLSKGSRILDLGCGSGRDSRAFSDMGYAVTPVDGSEGMCRIARMNTGLDVRHLTFAELDYADEFDGVWACSSLLHVPSDEFGHILGLIHRSLHDGGILYMSFKTGGYEGERDGRYYRDVTPDMIPSIVDGSGFDTVDIWKSLEPDRDVEWTNCILRKVRTVD